MKVSEIFHKFAQETSKIVGSAYAFMFAVLVIMVWAMLGPIFHYSDTWQLIINTGTTIITFLIVFLIQNSQNRDSMSLQLKLDELIRAVKEARNELIDVEDLSEEEIKRLKAEFERKK